ncbi:helix-turn-helix transcriptional regulator [Candidatus Dojkabacteria bacterium]|uniref:Helix-turn-helix transcriptional regulator n=1 Tax=Candidatus Dojkabacteria bacterium TaxID=2099670 RepID=A0A955IF76_9BACT|nr:helix-turn-helix transcriptional regulator [Candidatus Dojkabacteria bacterium]
MPDSLGSKIRFFRNRYGISQFDLETEIDASAGTLSRIENNEVNPLKETILKISKILKLSNEEIDYLIGITAIPAAESEINAAIIEASDELNKENKLCYVLDDRWRLIKFSDAFVKFLYLSQDEVRNMIGKTTAQLIVQENSPLLERLNKTYYKELLEGYLPIYYSNLSFMNEDPIYKDTVRDIENNHIASNIWKSISSNVDRSYTPEENRMLLFCIHGKDIPLFYSIQPLRINSRFVIVEYHTENKVSEILTGLVNN